MPMSTPEDEEYAIDYIGMNYTKWKDITYYMPVGFANATTGQSGNCSQITTTIADQPVYKGHPECAHQLQIHIRDPSSQYSGLEASVPLYFYPSYEQTTNTSSWHRVRPVRSIVYVASGNLGPVMQYISDQYAEEAVYQGGTAPVHKINVSVAFDEQGYMMVNDKYVYIFEGEKDWPRTLFKDTLPTGASAMDENGTAITDLCVPIWKEQECVEGQWPLFKTRHNADFVSPSGTSTMVDIKINNHSYYYYIPHYFYGTRFGSNYAHCPNDVTGFIAGGYVLSNCSIQNITYIANAWGMNPYHGYQPMYYYNRNMSLYPINLTEWLPLMSTYYTYKTIGSSSSSQENPDPRNYLSLTADIVVESTYHITINGQYVYTPRSPQHPLPSSVEGIWSMVGIDGSAIEQHPCAPNPPPPSAPPSSPPKEESEYIVSFKAVIAADEASFDRQKYKEAMAEATSTDVSQITLIVTAGSINVETRIATTTYSASTAIEAVLEPLQQNTTAASQLLGVEVESVEPVVVLTVFSPSTPPSAPPAAPPVAPPAASNMVVWWVAAVAASLLVLAGAGFAVWRFCLKPPKSSAPKEGGVPTAVATATDDRFPLLSLGTLQSR